MNKKKLLIYLVFLFACVFNAVGQSNNDSLSLKLYNSITDYNLSDAGLLNKIEELIKSGANPNEHLFLKSIEYKFGARKFGQYFSNKYNSVSFYSTPFHKAVSLNKISPVKKMIELGANPNIPDKEGVYPIEISLDEGDEDMILFLIKNGADLKNISIAYGLDDDIVKELLKAGADPNIPRKNNRFLIDSYLSFDSDSTMAFLLIDYGLDPALIDLSKCRSTLLTEELIKKGANPKTADINNGFQSEDDLRRLLKLNPNLTDIKLDFGSLFSNSKYLDILLESGLSIHTKEKTFGYPLIFGAVAFSDTSRVKMLLEKGARLTTRHNSESLIYHAVERNRADMVAFLLKNGANSNDKDNFGRTLLHRAIQENNCEIINILLDAGADIEYKTSRGYTPLMYATDNGDIEVVKTLVKKGANINYKKPSGETALILAIGLSPQFNKNKNAIIKFLVDNGAVTEIRYKGETLSEYAKSKNVSGGIIQYFNKTEHKSLTENDNERIKEILEDNNYGNLKQSDFEYIFSDEVILDTLLSLGLTINSFDKYDKLPLIFQAIKYGDTSSVNRILNEGVQITHRDKRKNITPLLFAVNEELVEMTEFLLSKGADPNDAGDFKKTALINAVRGNNEKIVATLINAGAEINKPDNSDYTPLMYAVEEKDIETVKMLIEKGADVNATGFFGENALFVAVRKKDLPILKLLTENGAKCTGKFHSNTLYDYAIIYEASDEMIKYIEQNHK